MLLVFFSRCNQDIKYIVLFNLFLVSELVTLFQIQYKTWTPTHDQEHKNICLINHAEVQNRQAVFSVNVMQRSLIGGLSQQETCQEARSSIRKVTKVEQAESSVRVIHRFTSGRHLGSVMAHERAGDK